MKLEAGQVWRKPDGTLWSVEDITWRRKPDGTPLNVCMAPSAGGVAEVFPALVITETWQRMPLALYNPSFIHTEPDKLEDEGT